MIFMRWVPVYGYPYYEISECGQLRVTVNGTLPKGWRGKKRGELHKPYGKYGKVLLTGTDKKVRYLTINRLMLLSFVGPPEKERRFAAHKDDNQSNNLLNNLYWATQHENEADKVRNGKEFKGEKHWKAKLTLDDAIEVIRLRRAGLTYKRIGEKFGVGLTVPFKICKGILWPEALKRVDS